MNFGDYIANLETMAGVEPLKRICKNEFSAGKHSTRDMLARDFQEVRPLIA